jgi:hypothetical protein
MSWIQEKRISIELIRRLKSGKSGKSKIKRIRRSIMNIFKFLYLWLAIIVGYAAFLTLIYIIMEVE